MEFEREIHAMYQQAYAHGLKSLDDKKKHRLPVCPAALSAILDEKMVSYRMDMGIMEIPTNLIIGVSYDTEDTKLYTQEFYPVCAPNTAYADSWRVLYRQYHEKNSFDDTISCFEYLGKFYVCDGLKRVSVAKIVGSKSIRAEVVRILPVRTESQEVVLYFDFLSIYRRTKLYQLQFTQKGFFDQLQTALGRRPGYYWTDADRNAFLAHWDRIEEAFYKSYQDSLRITAADALVVLLGRYSFDQIISMEPWVLARIFQAFWKELYALSFPEENKSEVIHTIGILQTA